MVEQRRARRRQRRVGAAIAASLAIVVTAAGLWIAGQDEQPSPAPTATGPSSVSAASPAATRTSQPIDKEPPVKAQPAGLRLSAGHGRLGAAPVPTIDGKPLGTRQIADIIARLPIWPGGGALAQPFQWPAQTIKTPPAGKSVTVPFPGTSAANKPDPTPTGPLARTADATAGFGVGRSVRQHHLRPTDGAHRHRRPTRDRRRPRHHHPEAGRHLAVDRHQHRPLRGRRQRRGPAADGHRLHPQGAGRNAGSERCDAGSSGHSDLQHAGSDSEALPAHRCQHGCGSGISRRLRSAGGSDGRPPRGQGLCGRSSPGRSGGPPRPKWLRMRRRLLWSPRHRPAGWWPSGPSTHCRSTKRWW